MAVSECILREMAKAHHCLIFSVVIGLLFPALARAQEIQFNRDVRPILSDHCYHCHGPDEKDRKGKLRLDTGDGAQGAYRTIDGVTAIKPKALSNSELWKRLITDDSEDVMPPTDSHKKPLSEAQKKIIKQWIEEGAAYEKYWAFVPPKMPKIPTGLKNKKWSTKPIDLLVLREIEAKGMTPSPPADKRTLIRRVTFDLTGLPPTRAEIKAFLADKSADAYTRLVDRLLASPQYGEHMAKYWLDLVRFADTNGMHHDHYRDMSPYRDWVIRSFNKDLPYNEFVRYQLAGDLFPNATQDQLIASGFNRLHLIIDRGTALPEESFTKNIIDRVTSVGTAFMGMTVGCAVCHDHKYDPLTTKDFYQLTAFFNNIDAKPETGGRKGADFLRGLQKPYINLTTPEQDAKLSVLDKKYRAETLAFKKLRSEEAAAKDPAKKKALAAKMKQAEKVMNQALAAKDKYEVTLPAAMIMKERSEVRPAHILVRGAYDKPGELVTRNSPAFLPPMKQSGEVKSRLDLANWFVAPDNPLTARVAVNRFWQQLFGVGIVKTAEDFGAQGDWPTHPDLLDYLTVFFTESGWDVKALMKEMVLSETYRQSSTASRELYIKDPENKLLARGSRFRLDSEMIRDQILATSGLINLKMYGKSVKPPQPPGLWKAVGMPYSYPRVFVADTDDKIYRRSVYTFWKRGMPPPQMTILNAPSRASCIARRERTNTPLQALLLMNEQEYLKAARHLALTSLKNPVLSTEQRLNILHETITSQLPDPQEKATYLSLLKDLQTAYGGDKKLAAEFCEGIKMPTGLPQSELAAWTMLASTFYNLDSTRYHQ